jgi:hypothetical protein
MVFDQSRRFETLNRSFARQAMNTRVEARDAVTNEVHCLIVGKLFKAGARQASFFYHNCNSWPLLSICSGAQQDDVDLRVIAKLDLSLAMCTRFQTH